MLRRRRCFAVGRRRRIHRRRRCALRTAVQYRIPRFGSDPDQSYRITWRRNVRRHHRRFRPASCRKGKGGGCFVLVGASYDSLAKRSNRSPGLHSRRTDSSRLRPPRASRPRDVRGDDAHGLCRHDCEVVGAVVCVPKCSRASPIMRLVLARSCCSPPPSARTGQPKTRRGVTVDDRSRRAVTPSRRCAPPRCRGQPTRKPQSTDGRRRKTPRAHVISRRRRWAENLRRRVYQIHSRTRYWERPCAARRGPLPCPPQTPHGEWQRALSRP